MTLLKNLCTKIGSGATPRGGKDSYKSEGTSIFRSQNILDWRFSKSGLAFIDDMQARKLENVSVQMGDILLNITGESVARACTAPCNLLPARVNQHVCIVRPDRAVLDSDYLLCVLLSMKQQLLKLASSGATRQALTKEMIENIEIDLPILSRQKEIVSPLVAIQREIDVLNRTNGYLAEYLWLQYDQYSKSCDRQICLGEMAEVIDCLHSKKPARHSDGKQLLQLDNIRDDGLLDVYRLKYFISDVDYYHWISRCEARQGDCVITNVGRVGAASQVPESVTAALGRNMTCVRPLSSRNYPTLLVATLTSPDMKQEIDSKTDSGTIMNALNVRNIPKLLVPFDSDGRALQFEEELRPIQRFREFLLKEEYLLASLRDALLPKLMSGEIDVSKVDVAQPNYHLH